MAPITPISVQITLGAMLFACFSGVSQVGKGVVVPSDQGHPARSSRADVEWNFRLGKQSRFALERMAGFVTPIESNEVLRKSLDEGWVIQNNVAPEHHLAIARGNLLIDFFEKIDVHCTFTFCFTDLLTLASTQVPGFIATDVEIVTGKMGKQLIKEPADKIHRAGMIGRQRGRIA